MATTTAYHLDDTGKTLFAFPLDSDLSASTWSSDKITMAESGVTGKYAATLDRDKSYAVFSGTTLPSSFSEHIAVILDDKVSAVLGIINTSAEPPTLKDNAITSGAIEDMRLTSPDFPTFSSDLQFGDIP